MISDMILNINKIKENWYSISKEMEKLPLQKLCFSPNYQLPEKPIKSMEKLKRKLTEEEKEKISFVVNDVIAEAFKLPEEPTEYDVLMQQKVKEFKEHLFKGDDPDEVEALIDLANGYIDDKDFSCYMAWAIMYDMWLNESCVWSVGHNPQWDEWEKLKEKKATKVSFKTSSQVHSD